MSVAVPRIEIAFNAGPVGAAVWTDVTPFAEAFDIERGRQHELDRIEAGTLSVTLKNDDRRFDPTYAAGPYYPNVKPMRRIRVLGAWDEIDYPRFYGYIEDWQQDWQRGEFRGQAHVRASDGLLLLSMRKISGSFSQQRSDLRIGALLDAGGWAVESPVWVLDSGTLSQLGSTTVLGPSGDRDLAQGSSDVQAVTYDDEDLTTAIQATVEAENGLFFMAADGLATFRGRNTINVPPFNVVQGTFGDDQAAGSAELPYRRLTVVDDETRIWNEIRFTRVGGAEQVAEDAASQSDYFERTYKRGGLLITTDAETLDAANYWLSRYKAPDQRIAGLDAAPQADDRLWAVLLNTEIGSLVRVRRRPLSSGSPGATIERTLAVGRIEERFRADGSLPGGFWEYTLGLIPSDAGRFWVLDSESQSQLGSTTVLGY